MIGEELYKRGHNQSRLKCITKEKTAYVMKKVHEGIYRYHSGS